MRVQALGLLRIREFRLLFVARGVSEFGDRLIPVALSFAVFTVSGSVGALGIVLAARQVPLIVFLLIAGVWADRLPRQLVMIAADATRAAVQAVSAALLITGHAEIWELAVLQGIAGIGEAFFEPASTGLVAQAVPRDRLSDANALMGIVRSGSWMIAPLVAGGLVVAFGAGSALAVDSATFAASGLCLLAMRLDAVPRAASSPFLRELALGWDAFRTNTWIWLAVLGFSLFALLGIAPFLALGPVIAKQSLGGAVAWGFVVAGGGIGSLVGGASALRVRPARPLATGFLLLILFAPVLALLAARAPVILIATALVAGQMAISFFNAHWAATFQAKVPEELLSRVSAFDWLGSYLSLPLGLAIAGPTAAVIGVSTTLWIAAGILVCLLPGLALAPAIRNVLSTQRA